MDHFFPHVLRYTLDLTTSTTVRRKRQPALGRFPPPGEYCVVRLSIFQSQGHTLTRTQWSHRLDHWAVQLRGSNDKSAPRYTAGSRTQNTCSYERVRPLIGLEQRSTQKKTPSKCPRTGKRSRPWTCVDPSTLLGESNSSLLPSSRLRVYTEEWNCSVQTRDKSSACICGEVIISMVRT